jgi:hypothetical protein
MSLYSLLNFLHLVGLAVFLLAHGVSGGASFALRGPVSPASRQVLMWPRRAAMFANPGLLLVIITGVWMSFIGSLWDKGWIWISIAILVAVIAAMLYLARPYYEARRIARQPDGNPAQPLGRARPMAAAGVGGVGLLLILGLMVFKPF